ncbi:toprim domain-containing protein [Sphingomonas sp. MG17]|uniref:Toprim domain-containing protein n=1 Tax=Sphingomonas tagetis TaxID=2949092 RepID=A0A9X2KN49_9SPHN|nr:toprim domain-containing protein [Sphingomonas tagetis]MCP3732161.1 toprim domain-containing protein [Sphingomonas tagetis]
MPTNAIKTSLEAAAERIVQQLGGQWRRHGAMCHCPAHDDRKPSLSVRLGRTSLLFKCFAGCDTIDVLRSLRLLRLSVPVDQPGNAVCSASRASSGFAAPAREIWENARPIAHTRAERYLVSRGIVTFSSALRYHPATPLGRGRAVRFRPALIAAVRQGHEIVSIQRLFLDCAGAALAPDLVKAKLTLGRPLRGAVQLFDAGATLGLAEGVESALSAADLLGIPVWATLGAERLTHIDIPNGVRRLVLLPDADRSGRLAEEKARAVYGGRDLELETQWPWAGAKDWNIVIKRAGGRGSGGVRHAA